MIPAILKKVLTAAVANNIALSQTPVSGTPLTLNGAAVVAGVAVLDTQRRILLTFGNEASDRTLVLTGTNDAGAAVSETLKVASGAGGTIASVYDYRTLTSAVPAGGGWTAAVTLGTNSVGSTPWWIPDDALTPFEVAANVEFPVAATNTTASVETTDDTLLMPMSIYGGQPATIPPPIIAPWSGLTDVGSDSYAVINHNCSGIRLTVTEGADGVAVQAVLRQSGIRQS